MDAKGLLSDDEANALVADSTFLWHQRFRLQRQRGRTGRTTSNGFSTTSVPHQLDGATVLDIGTTNGGGAFVATRRGAERVVAVDIYGPDRFGFDRLEQALGTEVEFQQGTIYRLPQTLADEMFDEVLFLGVLYHLRHPLLALDALRRLTRRHLYVRPRMGRSFGSPDGTIFPP